MHARDGWKADAGWYAFNQLIVTAQNLDGGDQERLVRSREFNLVTDLGANQRARQRGSEGDAARCRFALVMPDQVERAGLSVANEGDPRSKSDSAAIGNRGKLGAR
jgi:hypothetical protein